MYYRIEIDTSNGAFASPDGEDDALHEALEVSRILEDLSSRIYGDGVLGLYILQDVNGNDVGHTWTAEP